MKCILRRKSDGSIIKRADYPRVDLKPIVGLDQDLEWVIYEVDIPSKLDDYTENVEVQEIEELAGIAENPTLKKITLTGTIVPKPLAEAKQSLKVLVEDVASFNASVYAKQAVDAIIAGTPKATVLNVLGTKFNTMLTAVATLRSNIDGATLDQITTMKENVEAAREYVEPEVATPPISPDIEI